MWLKLDSCVICIWNYFRNNLYSFFAENDKSYKTFNVHEKYPNMLPEKTQKTDKPGLDYKNSCQQE